MQFEGEDRLLGDQKRRPVRREGFGKVRTKTGLSRLGYIQFDRNSSNVCLFPVISKKYSLAVNSIAYGQYYAEQETWNRNYSNMIQQTLILRFLLTQGSELLITYG